MFCKMPVRGAPSIPYSFYPDNYLRQMKWALCVGIVDIETSLVMLTTKMLRARDFYYPVASSMVLVCKTYVRPSALNVVHASGADTPSLKASGYPRQQPFTLYEVLRLHDHLIRADISRFL